MYSSMQKHNKVRVEQILIIQSQIVNTLENIAKNGQLSVDESKAIAIEILHNINYTENEYVWLAAKDNNDVLKFISTPLEPQLHNQSFADIVGAETQSVLMDNLLNKPRNTLVNYNWTATHSGNAAETESVALQTNEWGWFLGNGIQNENIKKEIQNNIIKNIFFIVTLCVFLMWVFYFSLKRELSGITAIKHVIHSFASGNLNPFHVKKLNNELDDITIALTSMQERIASLLRASDKNMTDLSHYLDELLHITAINKESAQQGYYQLENVSQSTSQLSLSASEIAINADNAQIAAKSAIEIIQDKNEISIKAQFISKNVSESITKSAKVIEQLHQYTERIFSVTDVIDKLSDQVNLLSLNAAIEAARAGDHGRGFAVVADEVRKLAIETQHATEDIRGIMIDLKKGSEEAKESTGNNISLVEESREIVIELSESFSNIQEKIMGISDINATVATSTGEQSHVTQEVSKSIHHLNDLINTNMKNIEINNEINTNIKKITMSIKEELNFFTFSEEK